MNNPNSRLPPADVVLHAQLQMSFRQLPTAISVGLVLAVAVAALLSMVFPLWLVLGWLGLLVITSLVRLFSLKHIASPSFKPAQASQYARRYIITALVLGCVWASLAFSLPYLPQAEAIFIVILLLSITGGALATNASHINSYLSYVVPIFLLLAVQLFSMGRQDWMLLGILSIAYAVFMIVAAWKLHQSLKDSTSLQLNWESIADELEETRKGLNQELKQHENTEKRLKQVMSELEEAIGHLERLSATDALTGLANRRSFDAALSREWSRARRNHSTIALLMIDVDHFKDFNDHYHHQSGDSALQRVALIIGGFAKRPGDIAARYGGEEFALILSGAGKEYIAAIAEDLRQQVLDLKIEHDASDVHDHLSISIGCAVVIAPQSSDYSPLISAADAALYRAKQEGRNRVCQAEI